LNVFCQNSFCPCAFCPNAYCPNMFHLEAFCPNANWPNAWFWIRVVLMRFVRSHFERKHKMFFLRHLQIRLQMHRLHICM
jgi:hypothetical protein